MFHNQTVIVILQELLSGYASLGDPVPGMGENYVVPSSRYKFASQAFGSGKPEGAGDKYGRILVRFHWDLQGAYSMRCRVSQNWAGAVWPRRSARPASML